MEQKLRIQEIQDKKNVSNVDLATRLNITKELVSYWRSGKRTPPIKTLQEIAEALSVNFLELLEAPFGFIHEYNADTGEWMGIRRKE